MSSNDDSLPDYLKGVEPAGGFSDRDNVTIRPGAEGELGRGPAVSKKPVPDDDDDEDEPRKLPKIAVPAQAILLACAVVVALAMLGAAGVAAMGTWIQDAERAALTAGGVLARVVDEERKIIDELGSRGANRAELLKEFADIDSAQGHLRAREALEFTRRIDKEIVAIGDMRGSDIYDRQKKLALAQKNYETALGAWESSSGNPIGALACAVGLASAPP